MELFPSSRPLSQPPGKARKFEERWKNTTNDTVKRLINTHPELISNIRKWIVANRRPNVLVINYLPTLCGLIVEQISDDFCSILSNISRIMSNPEISKSSCDYFLNRLSKCVHLFGELHDLILKNGDEDNWQKFLIVEKRAFPLFDSLQEKLVEENSIRPADPDKFQFVLRCWEKMRDIHEKI